MCQLVVVLGKALFAVRVHLRKSGTAVVDLREITLGASSRCRRTVRSENEALEREQQQQQQQQQQQRARDKHPSVLYIHELTLDWGGVFSSPA